MTNVTLTFNIKLMAKNTTHLNADNEVKKVSKKINEFFKGFKNVQYKKGDVILGSSESQYDIFYIKKGEVRVYTLNKEGKEVNLMIAKPGSYLPMMLYLAKRENKYFYEALSNLEVYKAPPEDVLSFISNNPDVLMELCVRFSSALCGLIDRVEGLTLGNAYYKITSLLNYLSKKFRLAHGNSVTVSLQLTQNDISNWFGLNRETVTRQIKILKKKGIISYNGRLLIINDMNKLSKEI